MSNGQELRESQTSTNKYWSGSLRLNSLSVHIGQGWIVLPTTSLACTGYSMFATCSLSACNQLFMAQSQDIKYLRGLILQAVSGSDLNKLDLGRQSCMPKFLFKAAVSVYV